MEALNSIQRILPAGTDIAGRYIATVRAYVLAHKVISTIVSIVVLGAGWYGYGVLTGTSGQTRYVLADVAEGTVVSSVTASGQVSANQSVSLMPKASGEILYVGVVPGQNVQAGKLIAEIDPTTALQSLTSAQMDLKSAQLALAKLTEPAAALTLAQAQNALASADSASRSDIVNTYLDLADIISGLGDISSRIGGNQFGSWNTGSSAGDATRTQAVADYQAADAAYAKAFADYQAIPIASADQSTIQRELEETNNTAALAGSAIKSASAYLNWYSEITKEENKPAITSAATDLTSLSTYATKLTTHAGALGADQSALQEKTLSLQQVQTGPDQIDVATQQLSVSKAEQAVHVAETTLANYYIRAPFDGIIGDVNIQKYDQAGSGAVATIIGSNQVADLSLNEVDAAKIASGDKATLTFDAVPDLTLTGTVAEIDPVGAVSQGVVSYDVKIAFDSQDSRIKTGMTVNASIQTSVHQNVLMVPSSAVKTTSGQTYVLAFEPSIDASTVAAAGSQGIISNVSPQIIPVTAGISDGTNTEITSGLDLGEQIVVRTITGSAAARTTATTASAGATSGRGGGFGGGNAIRL